MTEITDATGNLVEYYTYDPYGNVTVYDRTHTVIPANAGIQNPYMFTGRRLDYETGLYYYRARMYDPMIGRFLQRDPMGYYDSMNLYAYVINNPVNWVDPYGEAALVLGGGLTLYKLLVVAAGLIIATQGVKNLPDLPLPRNIHPKEEEKSKKEASSDTSSQCPLNPGDPEEEDDDEEDEKMGKDKKSGQEITGTRETHTDHTHGQYKNHDHWLEWHENPATGKGRKVRRTGPPQNTNN